MVMEVLSAAERQKIDGSDDALFYAEPRFVQHLDAAFRARLTELYRERIPQGAVVLDLMGSWVSHLPEDGDYAEVIGHGLNERELQANPRLSRHWVQNLNSDQTLPLADASVDAALVVAGWQYLQRPEAIAAELLRVLRPGGQLIVAFSNRMFAQKAPRIWLEGTDRDRLAYVARVLIAQGWPRPELLAEATRDPGPLGWLGGHGDPFFAVIATRPGAVISPAASAASGPAAPQSPRR
jgi:SAM-dependent methyltransferase